MTSTIRVLYMDHIAALSGGEIALLNLLRHLNRQKVEPVVVFGEEGPLTEMVRLIAETHVMPLSPAVGKAKKATLGLWSLLRVSEGASLMSYIWHLAQFIKLNDIDLVHTNSLKSDIIGGLAARLSGRPVVWHVRDRIEDDYLPGPVVRVFRILCRMIPCYIIANSQATLSSLHLDRNESPRNGDASRPNKRRSEVVHDGTDSVDPSPREVGEPGVARIGLIGRISPWKGQHIFLQAAAYVHERFPRAEFVIIGSALFGEDSYESQIRLLPKQLGIEEVVHFAGFRANIRHEIEGLDLVVHASTTGEPFGQVIIEGMAAAKPIVATDGGGVPEIVDNGKTGILVPMADAKSMASAICRLLEDPDQAKRMGAEGLHRFRDHFTIEQTARKVEAIYQGIARLNS